jgi:Tfp pilus assembly protein PilO
MKRRPPPEAAAGGGVKMAKSKFKLDLKDPKVKHILLALLVVVGGGFYWFDSFYTPKSETIAALEEQKAKAERDLVEINSLRPQIENLRRESAVLTARLDSLKNIFPDGRELPRLIRELTAINRKSGVATTRFTPKPEVIRDYYVENKYDVEVEGNYHDLGALFSHLANFQFIVNLANVSIRANPSFGSGSGGDGFVERQPSVQATFEMTTFSSRRQ